MRLWLLTGKAGLHWQAFLVQFAKKKKIGRLFFAAGIDLRVHHSRNVQDTDHLKNCGVPLDSLIHKSCVQL
jgi:hypothetical protein